MHGLRKCHKKQKKSFLIKNKKHEKSEKCAILIGRRETGPKRLCHFCHSRAEKNINKVKHNITFLSMLFTNKTYFK